MKTTAELKQTPPDSFADIRVLTASEFKQIVRDGRRGELQTADVVTCGTFGIMSGTSVVVSFQAAEPGVFERASAVFFNGVPAAVGPCPNENNGRIDAVIFGTAVSSDDPNYGGGRLFRDMVSGRIIRVRIETDGGVFERLLSLTDFETARMITTRTAFKNYTAFVNPMSAPFSTIFAVRPMPGALSFASVSGCGEINPLQNDPHLRFHTPGTCVLLNGAPGRIIGTGTRHSPDRPNLAIHADLKGMDPDLMGGFITSKGPECLVSVATAIPVTDDRVLADLCVTDDQIPLPVADIQTRVPFASASYADVWAGTDRFIHVSPEKCRHCAVCTACSVCPVRAIDDAGAVGPDCVSCLTCVSACLGGVYEADGGALTVEGRRIPVGLRQSDRNRGEKAAALLKSFIREGRWVF